jgi:hypothetical protein
LSQQSMQQGLPANPSQAFCIFCAYERETQKSRPFRDRGLVTCALATDD